MELHLHKNARTTPAVRADIAASTEGVSILARRYGVGLIAYRLQHKTSDQDIQWSRIVELKLVPHSDQPWPEIAEMDYGMQRACCK
jgi:hypothetical protein